MVYAHPNIYPGEWNVQTPMGFWDTKRSPNLEQTTGDCHPPPKKKQS